MAGTHDTGPTRVLSGAEARASGSSARSSEGTTTTAGLPRDALRQDALGRLRVFAQLMLMLALAGLPITPFLGSDPVRPYVFLGLLGHVALTYGILWWFTLRQAAVREADPARVDLIVGALAMSASIASSGLEYVFGVFSPAGMITTIAMYAYALGAPPAWTIASYVVSAGGHALLATLVISGVVVDHGLVPATGMSHGDRILVQVCVQLAYLIAVVIGLASRKKTMDAVEQLEKAVRQITEREALLAEVRHQFEHAAGIGEPGRFTEHVFGSWRLGVVIGRGAMGEVYAATHATRGDEAAVKLLPLRTLASPEMLARFHREAQIARSLDSPHVVRVLDVSPETSELPYLAMERLRGDDLGHTLREERRLSLPETVELTRQVARGLEAARAAGIVHRDLKPSNLFRADGTAGTGAWKILDFGVSKLDSQTGTLTRDAVIGTPGYMAPEQARAGDADHRADIYGLAAVVYRCLTGQATFVGGDFAALVYRAVHEMPVRPSELAPETPVEVDAVLAIALAKSPDDRFARVIDFADALALAARGELDPALHRRAETILARIPWGGATPPARAVTTG